MGSTEQLLDLQTTNEYLAQLRDQGYGVPLPLQLPTEFLPFPQSHLDQIFQKPLAWGGVWRLRWGRKTVWREASESALDD